MSEDWWGIFWLFFLLAGNAFFVGAEFAVISAKRSQIEPRAEEGSKRAKTALYAMEHATLMLATSQLGITVNSLLILLVSEPALHHLLEIPLGSIGIDPAWVSTIAFIIALLVVTYLHVVLGEMVPKNISFSLPEQAVLLLAPPLVLVSTIISPIIRGLNAVANAILRLTGVEPKQEATSAYTLDEVATIVAESTREGILEDHTGALTAAFEFTEKTARDVAIPLADLITLPEGATPHDVEHALAQHGFSRYVLVDDDGEPNGYLHIKDVLDIDPQQYDYPLPPKRLRSLISVVADTDLEDAMAMLRRTRSHLARVMDESGQTTGVLFLEDIIEELVGEVRDATRRGVRSQGR
ncbi:hemolysin family protein [Pontimonas sp.]|uniref:hemolysin family protein n=1 Tax=Pontimonas sp. TaxID=2304492 RepID=UPI00287036CD|nr:hemolysin family protein [Pontimonas sp.]MDR9396736.1 hemolysin family protein [Pontimonas sp.]MDR9434301.1 hemolysin family protein [Pontimonas sp.]